MRLMLLLALGCLGPIAAHADEPRPSVVIRGGGSMAPTWPIAVEVGSSCKIRLDPTPGAVLLKTNCDGVHIEGVNIP